MVNPNVKELKTYRRKKTVLNSTRFYSGCRIKGETFFFCINISNILTSDPEQKETYPDYQTRQSSFSPKDDIYINLKCELI